MSDLREALKPCPFCGADFLMGQEPHDNQPVEGKFYIFHEHVSVDCAANKCRLDIRGHFDTKEEAIAFWNTRAALAQPQDDGEAVAWRWRYRNGPYDWHFSRGRPTGDGEHLFTIEPLFTAPPTEARMRRALEIDTTFSSALDRVKAGASMHRRAWKSNKFIRVRKPIDGSLTYLELAYVDGRCAPWTPTRCDLMESDWREFEALRAGDNHASDGKESEGGESECCGNMRTYQTSVGPVLDCCRRGKADPTPPDATAQREAIASTPNERFMPRMLILDDIHAVCVGGRWDGWKFYKHPDGKWVSLERLKQEPPIALQTRAGG